MNSTFECDYSPPFKSPLHQMTNSSSWDNLLLSSTCPLALRTTLNLIIIIVYFTFAILFPSYLWLSLMIYFLSSVHLSWIINRFLMLRRGYYIILPSDTIPPLPYIILSLSLLLWFPSYSSHYPYSVSLPMSLFFYPNAFHPFTYHLVIRFFHYPNPYSVLLLSIPIPLSYPHYYLLHPLFSPSHYPIHLIILPIPLSYPLSSPLYCLPYPIILSTSLSSPSSCLISCYPAYHIILSILLFHILLPYPIILSSSLSSPSSYPASY